MLCLSGFELYSRWVPLMRILSIHFYLFIYSIIYLFIYLFIYVLLRGSFFESKGYRTAEPSRVHQLLPLCNV